MAAQIYDREFFVRAGREGGKAKNAKLSARQRKNAARKAAAARWAKQKKAKAEK